MWVKDQELLLLRQEIEDLKRQLNELRVGQSGGFRKRPEDLLLPANANDGDIAVYDASDGVWKTSTFIREMTKTFYVDAVNGNDANDGSETAPFQTIKKACDSVPVGGFGIIYLTGTITMNEIVELTSKTLLFTSKTGQYTVEFPIYDNGTHRYIIGFLHKYGHSYIAFNKAVLKAVDNTGGSTNSFLYEKKAFFMSGITWGMGGKLTVELGGAGELYNEIDGCYVVANPLRGSLIDMTLVGIDCYFSNLSKLAYIYYGTMNFNKSYNVKFYRNGSEVSIDSSFFDGITYDADGKPRNLVSNIII